MRYLAKATALTIVVALLVPTIVLATDYIKDAADALKQSPVYVAPGTEGTDRDTAGKLQARLEGDDNVVLIMLPAAAKAELQTDTSTIASRLSEQLENKRIIGLAVGNEVVGYAPTLPPGIAADQMRRAKSVSNDPLTALSTFAQNMHIWEREHPQPTPAPFDSPSSGKPWFVWLLILLPIGIVAIAFLAWFINAGEPDRERIRFRAPGHVKDLLTKIEAERERVFDPELQQTLRQICVDIDNYFQSSSEDKKRDTLIFRDRLAEVIEILDKYLEVQDHPRYFTNPNKALGLGKAAFTDFSVYVLASIQRGNDADLRDYKLNTNVMQERRSAAFPDEI